MNRTLLAGLPARKYANHAAEIAAQTRPACAYVTPRIEFTAPALLAWP